MACSNGRDFHDGTGTDFGCKIKSIQVAPSATPSRKGGAHAKSANEMEKQWGVDMPRYKALREQGVH